MHPISQRVDQQDGSTIGVRKPLQVRGIAGAVFDKPRPDRQTKAVTGHSGSPRPTASRDGRGVCSGERRVDSVTSFEPDTLQGQPPQIGGRISRGVVRAEAIPHHDEGTFGNHRLANYALPSSLFDTPRIENAYARPIPQPAPVLMIGGGGERLTLRVVAQHADWWNCDYYSPTEYGRKLEVLRAHCRAIGRDPAEIVPTCYMGVTVSHDATKLVRRRSMAHRGEVHVISGNPDEVAEQIVAFVAVGVRHMQLNFLDFPRSDSLDLFLSDVFPRFSRLST
jgi:Luciferase-like monooxygenase